jgi:hypothetical protein
MKILNKVLALTATAALLTSSTLAISNINPTLEGIFRIVPTYKYDDIEISNDKVYYAKDLLLKDIIFSEENRHSYSMKLFAINRSNSPTGQDFAISTKVGDMAAAKYISVNVFEISETGNTIKMLYTGTMAQMAYNPPLLDIKISNTYKPTTLLFDWHTPENLDKEISTSFDISIIPMKNMPISSPIM